MKDISMSTTHHPEKWVVQGGAESFTVINEVSESEYQRLRVGQTRYFNYTVGWITGWKY